MRSCPHRSLFDAATPTEEGNDYPDLGFATGYSGEPHKRTLDAVGVNTRALIFFCRAPISRRYLSPFVWQCSSASPTSLCPAVELQARRSGEKGARPPGLDEALPRLQVSGRRADYGAARRRHQHRAISDRGAMMPSAHFLLPCRPQLVGLNPLPHNPPIHPNRNIT